MADISIRKAGSTNRDQKKDALVIHGMFSSGHQLAPFAKALTKRECYRNVYYLTIYDFRHKYIPKIKQKSMTEKILLPQVAAWIRSKKLSSRIDIIGHSNGGYAAIHLANMLPKGLVDIVFTVATPSGLFRLPVEWDNISNIVHFVGAHDKVIGRSPVPGDGQPTHSRVVFIFPDECHCSIHTDADTNGLADIIAYMNHVKASHAFADSNNVIHIWEWCHEEFTGSKYLKPPEKLTKPFYVCNGIHGDGESSLEKRGFLRSKIPFLLDVFAVRNYYRVTHNLVLQEEQLREELAYLKWDNMVLEEDLAELESESKQLRLIKIRLEKKIEENQKRIIGQLRDSRGNIQGYLDLANSISQHRHLTRTDLDLISELMKEALEEYRRFNTVIKGQSSRAQRLGA